LRSSAKTCLERVHVSEAYVNTGLISTLYINILAVDIGGTIILKWILKLEQYCILDSAGPGQGPVTGCCK